MSDIDLNVALPEWVPAVPFQHFWVLPVVIGADYLLGRYVGYKGYSHRSPFNWVLGEGTMGRWGLAFVVVCHFIDDVGTGVGFQATEQPLGGFEGGVQMRKDIAHVMKNGLARTETEAMRTIWITNLGVQLLLYYLGWYSSWTRAVMYVGALKKVQAGYGWWSVRPNKFSILDFFFGQSQRTPDRVDLAKWSALQSKRAEEELFNSRLHFVDERRRLVEAESVVPFAWQLLDVLFP